MKDAFAALRNAKNVNVSVEQFQILKITYHSTKLSESSKPFCSILHYFRSASYVHQGMPIGIWQTNINAS